VHPKKVAKIRAHPAYSNYTHCNTDESVDDHWRPSLA
jgi:hypothetical protein